MWTERLNIFSTFRDNECVYEMTHTYFFDFLLWNQISMRKTADYNPLVTKYSCICSFPQKALMTSRSWNNNEM